MKIYLLLINCERRVTNLHSSYYSGMRTGRAEDRQEGRLVAQFTITLRHLISVSQPNLRVSESRMKCVGHVT